MADVHPMTMDITSGENIDPNKDEVKFDDGTSTQVNKPVIHAMKTYSRTTHMYDCAVVL